MLNGPTKAPVDNNEGSFKNISAGTIAMANIEVPSPDVDSEIGFSSRDWLQFQLHPGQWPTTIEQDGRLSEEPNWTVVCEKRHS